MEPIKKGKSKISPGNNFGQKNARFYDATNVTHLISIKLYQVIAVLRDFQGGQPSVSDSGIFLVQLKRAI